MALTQGKHVDPDTQPVVDTDAYTANDAVGGLLTFSNVGYDADTVDRVVFISGATLKDDAKQKVLTELWLFNQTFTATADDATWAPSDADMENFVTVIPFTAYYDGSDNTVAVWDGSKQVALSGSKHLYGQLVTRGTPTYAAAGDLTVRLQILED